MEGLTRKLTTRALEVEAAGLPLSCLVYRITNLAPQKQHPANLISSSSLKPRQHSEEEQEGSEKEQGYCYF